MPKDPDLERQKIENRELDQWIDEGSVGDGSVRDEAIAATSRAAGRDRSRPPEVDPEVVAEIQGAVDSQRATRLAERLTSASQALDRERYEEARRIAKSLVKELPEIAAVHEVVGLSCYRLGRWQQAVAALDTAYALRSDPSLLPVLADCHRALKNWDDVDRVWGEIKAASPPHDVMAEARMVVAGSLADRGDLGEAIAVMQAGQKQPKKVREHHLREWYVIADLYDRAGDTVTAARWFNEIAAYDADYVDVRDRLRSLGR